MPDQASAAWLSTEIQAAAETLWNFHRIDDKLHAASVCIGLGSQDIGVADYTAELYHGGVFPLIVFSGANAPTTRQRFPRGEAVHYREHAVSLGVLAEAILLETRATTTPENITLAREPLESAGIAVSSVILTCRPCQQRRAKGIFVKIWPEPELVCSGQRVPLDRHIAGIGDAKRIIDMLVGDTQRLRLGVQTGWAIEQEIPPAVWVAYERLVAAGFTSRVIQTA